MSYKKYEPIWLYTVIVFCFLVMLPRLLSPQFGLMDDGRSLSVAEGITHGKWDLSWDLQSGRARPLYWAAFAFWYLLAGGHPFWYFLGSLVVFSLTTIFLIRLVLELGGSRQQAFASGLFYVLSAPVIENVYTLSKGENLQLFLLISAVLLAVIAAKDFHKGKRAADVAGMASLILAACMVKETALALIPISLVWWASAWVGSRRGLAMCPFAKEITRLIAMASLLGGMLYYLARTIYVSAHLTEVGYTSNFDFTVSQILNGLVRWGGWIMRDYLWLIPLLLVGAAFLLINRRWPASWLWWFAMVWMTAWLGLYLPWYFVVEYYLLPFAAGAAILAGVLIIETTNMLKNTSPGWRLSGAAALGLSAVLFAGTLANNAASASLQLAQDDANAGALRYVAENAPDGSAVIVNIQFTNEYVEQMQLMLKDFYNRPDLYFSYYQKQDLTQLVQQNPAVLVLVPELEGQPLMTVRTGLIEPTQQQWNSSLLPLLSDSWQVVYQVTRSPRLLTIDYPRLLCPVIYRENYCSGAGGLVNFRTFLYQWTVYQSK
jgi:hypothetical protein